MSHIETTPIKNTTIMLIYSEKDEINLSPSYQRMGDVWPLEKRQLLIDSILNDYDIPKIYFHIYNRSEQESTGYTYSAIDGRQRLETIWKFMDGNFALSEDFEYQRDPSIRLGGLSYEEIAKQYPKIRINFDSFVLPIVGIRTDDEDLIEDMFSRLNEAVPLNAAEKRNAFGGDAVDAIRRLGNHSFFTHKVKFKNNRYQHMDVAARILLTEYSLATSNRLMDTKKIYLDNFVKQHRHNSSIIRDIIENTTKIVDYMAQTFLDSDDILRAQGNIVLYYLIFRKAIELNEERKISRNSFTSFRDRLAANRQDAEASSLNTNYQLLEYDRLSQQGTNDSSNIRERFRTLADAIGLSSSEI